VGVCAAIVPFNFPAMVPFWFLPFAIATGNTFVLKPSEQVPLTQNRVFELIDRLELPPGVVNLVNGDAEVAQAILESRDRRRLVRRLGTGRGARLRYGGSARQARAGARGRQEPHGGDARRGDRTRGRGDRRERVRGRRPALHGRIGGGDGRRGGERC
jgi:hypothetical protein